MSAAQSRVKHADVLPRLETAAAEIGSIADAVKGEAYCVDILARLRAVAAELRQAEDSVLGQHVESCVAAAVDSGDAGDRDRKVAEILAVIGGSQA